MKKQYMDFVPANRAKKPASAVKSHTTKVVGSSRVRTTKQPTVSAKTVKSQRIATPVRSAVRKPAKSTTLRPKTQPKPQARSMKASNTFVPPKANFINQEKVVKRPLSKNVYRKRLEEKLQDSPTETPQGPVTIISKPEKDAHIGVIVTVIITIILGAAAGTVAFLLLPK